MKEYYIGIIDCFVVFLFFIILLYSNIYNEYFNNSSLRGVYTECEC